MRLASLLDRARPRDQSGSALTEAALITPALILLVWWSAAITDVSVLRLKVLEASRFALWEMTVFRTPTEIQADVQSRFADLKSGANTPNSTGLLSYPKPGNLTWTVHVNPQASRASIGGSAASPPGQLSGILHFINEIAGVLAGAVDGATRLEKFNTYEGTASVQLGAVHSGSIILNGGDLGPHRSGGQDMAGGNVFDNLVLCTEGMPAPCPAAISSGNPMRLIYDSWKAWPKPALYTTDGASGALTDPTVSPMQTYPVVESMVSQQVNQIAFFGLNSISFFNQANNFLGSLLSSGFGQAALGGDLPTFFATAPMDHALNDVTNHPMPVGSRGSFPIGPISILPVAAPDVGWAPGGGMFVQRLGDLGSPGTAASVNDDTNGVSGGADRSRYTVPYRINTQYWSANGGTPASTEGASATPVPVNYSTGNNYVKVYGCRGHYFAGARTAQVTNYSQRYSHACPN